MDSRFVNLENKVEYHLNRPGLFTLVSVGCLTVLPLVHKVSYKVDNIHNDCCSQKNDNVTGHVSHEITSDC